MKLIARGRDADVYALDDATVLRRYRHAGPVELEARLMSHLHERGFPVPQVYEATDTDLVMERVHGPTMLEALSRRPWRAHSLGRLLGTLHDEVHAVPAPPWLPTRFPAENGDRILHLDLHPGNVILSRTSPMVIDWRNAAAGDPAADLAMTIVIIASSDTPGPFTRMLLGRLVRGLRGGSLSDPLPRLNEAARARLTDPNLTPAEARRLRTKLRRR